VTQEGGQYDAESIGQELRLSLSEVIESIPDCSMRPTDIARKINVSRVMISRMLSALRKENTIELLTSIPGPESLKTLILAASIAGVEQHSSSRASAAVNDFETMLKGKYGTRAAFNAALSVNQTNSKEKFEQSSRYQVYKGMSQILGVECKLWVASAVFTPSKESTDDVCVTSFFGPAGMRRLRPDVPILLEYGRPVTNRFGQNTSPLSPPPDMQAYYSNPEAVMSVCEKHGEEFTTFSPQLHSKGEYYDMVITSRVLVKDYHTQKNGYGKRGRSVFPKVPVASMVSDLVIHKDVYSQLDINLKVYKTLGKGTAAMGDVKRVSDIIDTGDQFVNLGFGLKELSVQEMPKYKEMVEYICDFNGYAADEFRVYRLQIQYPIYGFQYLAEFDTKQ